MYNSILVPIDFSSESAAAVDTAAKLAKSPDVKMHLLNVIEDPYTDISKMVKVSVDAEQSSVLTKLKTGIEGKLGELIVKLNANGIETSFSVEVGNIFKTISNYVQAHEIDLLIMGSKGVSGVEEVLVGSITEKVVKYVTCPVITVKEKADLSSIKSIVYPTDLKEEQELVLHDIKALQKKHQAHLHMVKVYDSDFISKNEIEERMEKFAAYFELEDYSVSAVRHMDEAEAILQFAQNLDATMIAMATHHRRGLEVLFNTRISKNVVNHGKRPIWTKRVN